MYKRDSRESTSLYGLLDPRQQHVRNFLNTVANLPSSPSNNFKPMDELMNVFLSLPSSSPVAFSNYALGHSLVREP